MRTCAHAYAHVQWWRVPLCAHVALHESKHLGNRRFSRFETGLRFIVSPHEEEKIGERSARVCTAFYTHSLWHTRAEFSIPDQYWILCIRNMWGCGFIVSVIRTNTIWGAHHNPQVLQQTKSPRWIRVHTPNFELLAVAQRVQYFN